MTSPVITPKNSKAFWATVIPALGSLAPLIAQLAGALPPPWGLILSGIGGVFSLISGRMTYQAPYVPPGATLAPISPAAPPLQNPYA